MAGPNDTVHVGVSIVPIYMDYDPEGTLEGLAWFIMGYRDERLAFDPAKYGGIERYTVDAHRLWKPDIELYNR